MTTTKERVRRIKMNQVSPELYEAMVVLNTAAHKDIDPELAELIKIRASQMNHCAFCLDMHTTDARSTASVSRNWRYYPRGKRRVTFSPSRSRRRWR